MESRNLDFLRTVAVSMVVISHLAVNRGNPVFAGLELSMLGQLGVCIFFVHTSWVLMLSLKRQSNVKSFYLRRFFRIYPLSIFTVFVIWFFGLPMLHCLSPMKAVSLDPQQIVANFGLFQNFYKANSILGPLWSLPVEVQMYITLPFFFFFAKSRKTPFGLMAIWAVAATLLFWVVPIIDAVNKNTLAYYQIPNILHWSPCFIAGVVAYKISETQDKRNLPSWILPVLIAFLAFSYMHSWEFTKNYFITITLAMTLPFIKEIQSGFTSKVCKTIAKYSYSIYLLHYFSLWFTYEVYKVSNFGLGLIVFFASLGVFSFAAFHLIEDPFIKLGNKLAFRFVRPLPKITKKAA
jgi:peptidoglycan/LPS O-acetylase OafA/YrhL